MSALLDAEKDQAQAKLKALAFKLGVYQHYKGQSASEALYLAFAVTLHERTLEPLVHYFRSEVDPWGSGACVPRFAYVREWTPRELADALTEGFYEGTEH
jgi:hypothetical protein